MHIGNLLLKWAQVINEVISLNSETSNQRDVVKTTYIIIVSIIFLTAAAFIFNDSRNDTYGWLIMFAAFALNGIFELYRSIQSGEKFGIIFNILFAFVALSILIWGLFTTFF